MKEKIKVLFICLGNICRSPAAEGAFKNLVKQRKLDHLFEIDSCGTSGYHDGELADPRTRKVAETRGIRLTHLSRKLTKSDLIHFDYLLVMDENNFHEVRSLTNESKIQDKILLFGKFRSDAGAPIVPDPYYKNETAFEKVQDLVEDCSLGFLNFLGEIE
ncbi:low molecular weight protein-tyrosine-phosphatase [Leptospira bandrabouensis]|uniref:protein-tyrosine-phosphatase n=1 Tax=Leptospira bandrabouensis TaxID=2484903 RepID=A0A6H3NJN9_9LEPT|nr:low molecular weight protein-tyrosine-phosphatase [Leptospira bandrabouensis]MCG6153884.1 low molecular weight phosphotyrosine protein phosphatase [Leptospira bandrabouensis]MCW7457909.1 low molecular weight phosphotyrosine protein phosphatase [Leptospira bandrabouensis]MCW7479037.1 low molecular weight phosphotyrosine protein phosphatase [Leptospira bandrabouensis]MCW7486835.1 low molecular weight phosphotyrosine protein phosphatase [Leptospira bandrabouensis]TGN08827.1 low molecular weigh